ncbi:MAG: UDP-2,3-diacylglucosamine diphosphatase LpxI [Candidatus Omnitrophica bacterium]|nr:UDP-2,3-diacylglucosamine diphosphatase LpxI [Candidatus Omnitrophota bacterium]
MERIGLIAGNRKFPLLFCEGARKSGFYIVAVAIKGETSRRINSLADKVFWLKLSDFSRIFGIFKNESIKRVVMAGQVSPYRLFSKEVVNNPDINQILSSIRNKKADTIFGAIADRLKDAGLDLIDSTIFVKDYIPGKGVLTAQQPDAQLLDDINFGLGLARSVGALDIGQTVAVRDKAIVAVEALEGTDNLILRAGRLVGGGITVVKVAKPNQDMRFDIPVIGLKTIKRLIMAGAKCLAFEADKTLFIDREASIRLAGKKGIVVVAV